MATAIKFMYRSIINPFFFFLFSRYPSFNSNLNKMAIDLYYLPGSAPCRAVLMGAKAVGVELNLKLTDLLNGEHLKPEFLAVSILSFYSPLLMLFSSFISYFQSIKHYFHLFFFLIYS